MANGESRTDVDNTPSGDEPKDISQDLQNIYDSANTDLLGDVSSNPEKLSLNNAYVNKIQQVIPDYQGRNVYNVKYDLIHNKNGELDRAATRLLTIKAENEPEWKESLEDPETYEEEYGNIKNTIKENLLKSTVTGESVSKSIVDRQYELSQREKPASASYKNNNPLNMMATSISSGLADDLTKEGVIYKYSSISNEDGTLAKFNSYEDGLNAAKIAIKRGYASSTVNDFLKSWSNEGYNARELGIPDWAGEKVSNLTDSQLNKVVRRMQKAEGWNEGKIFDNNVPIEEYKQYIQNNPDKYSDYNILNQNGSFIRDEEGDLNASLITEIENNEELHKQLIEDRYQDFEDSLNNEYNVPNQLQGSPSFKAQSYAVYDKFGSEGLTKFVNLIQGAQQDDPSPQTEKDLEWYRKNNVGRLRQEFIGQGSKRIKFSPPKSTIDRAARVPADANSYGSIQYKFDQDKRQFVEKEEDVLVEGFMEKYGVAPITQKEETREQEQQRKIPVGTATLTSGSVNAFEYLSNIDYFTEDQDEYREQVKNDIKNYEESGLVFTKGYDVLLNNMVDYHKKEGTTGDLIKTLQANGQHVEGQKWRINYDSASRTTKMAADALNQSAEFSHLVYPDKNGNMVLELDRSDRISKQINKMAMEDASKIGQFKWTYNEDSKDWEKEFDNDFLGQVENTLQTIRFGSLQMLDRHFIGPAMEHSANALRSVADMTGLETPDDIASFIDFQSESDLVEGLNSIQFGNPFDFSGDQASDLAFIENGGFVPKTVGNLTPIAQVMGSIYLKGRATLSGLNSSAQFIDKMGKTSKAMSALGASKYLKGNKFSLLMDKWNEAQKAKKFWTYGGTFYLGDAVEEISMPKNQTIMNFATDGVDKAMESYMGMETNVNQDYRTTNGITRLGLDMLASFGLSSAVDNFVIAPFKYTKDWGALKVGKQAPTLDVDPATGRLVKEDLWKTKPRFFGEGNKRVPDPYWRNDMTEFYHNITKDLDQWGVERAGQEIQEGLISSAKRLDPEQDKDLSYPVSNFIKDMGEYAGDDLKASIRETTDHYNKLFGNKLSDEQLGEITETRYDSFLDTIGEGMYELFSKANRENPNSLPLKIADVMEQTAVTMKHVQDDAGNRLFDLETANSLTNGFPFRIKKKVGDGYVVKDLQENSWALDLASRIRQRAGRTTINNAIDKERVIRNGLDDAQEESLRNVWSYLHGRKIATEDGDVAYITGVGDTRGFKAVSETGEQLDEVGIKRFSDAPEDVQEYITQTNPARATHNLDETTQGLDEPKGTRINRISDTLKRRQDFEVGQKALQNVEEFLQFYKRAADTEEVDLGFKGSFNTESRNTYGYTETNQSYLGNLRESGRKSIGMVAKAARNIGVDDERILNLVRRTKSGKEKRVIGKKNQTKITEFDPDKVGKGLPRGVAVKRTNSDGQGMYFLTNKKTKLAPSRWVETEEGLRINPDWDMVNKNQTLDNDDNIQEFVREVIDGNAVYRLPEGDESGSTVLNIQNPTRADGYLSDKELASKDVDAYVRNINGKKYYEPVSEQDQALQPESILKEKERKAVFGEQSGEDNSREVILQNVAQAGFGKGLTRGAAGYLGGALLDGVGDWFEPEEDSWNFSDVGAILGLALGFKPTRNVIKDVGYKGVRGTRDRFDDLYNWAKEMGEDPEFAQFREIHNPSGDLRKKSYQTWAESLRQSVESFAFAGKSIFESFSENRYVQSTFSMLQDLKGIEGVDSLQKLLLNTEHTPNEMKSNLSIDFNRRMRQAMPDEYADKPAYDEVSDQMARWTDDYIRDNELGWVEIGQRQVRTSKMTDREKAQFFNEQYWRAMQSNARRLDDGRYHRTPTKVTNHMYLNAEDVSKFERADQALIDDPYWGTFLDTQRDWFEEYKGEWLGLIKNYIDQNADTISPRYKNIAERLRDTNQSLNDFKEGLEEADKKLYQEGVGKSKLSDAGFQRIIEAKKVRDKFQDFGREYYPQVFSNGKFEAEQSRFINDYLSAESGATEAEAKQAYMKKVFNDWRELNDTSPRVLQKYSTSDEKVVNSNFATRQEAEAEFRNIVNGDDRFGIDHRRELLSEATIGNYIRKIDDVVQKADGTYETNVKYILEEPQQLADIYGVFERANSTAYENMFDIISSGSLVKNSNFLEKPRDSVIPNYLAEDNLETIVFKYAEDVGTRLHYARENILLEDDLSKEYLTRIKKSVQEQKGRDKARQVNDRLKDLYRQQTGIIKELRTFDSNEDKAAYMASKRRKAELMGTIRNVIGSGYIHGIAWYDIFQHAVMSPLLTSWGSWGKSMKVLSATDSMSRMNNTGKTLGYATQKLKTFLPEIDELSYGNSSSWSSTAYKTSKGLINWAGDFSFTKAIGEKTGMFNVEDWGAFRLLADGFYGVNQTATSINGLAHLVEAEELANAWRQLQGSDQQTIRRGLKTYNEGDIRRGLEKIGVYGDEIEDFANKSQQVNEFIDYIQGKEGRGLSVDDLDSDQFKYIRRILETATDSYHGRNKMFRPESWNTPVGRLAGQYSFYPMNFSVQTLQRRIRQPLQQWNNNHAPKLKNPDYPAWKLTMDLQSGDTQKIRGLFKGTDEEIDAAINDFPIDAWVNVLKLLPATGLTFAMTMTTDAVQDIVGMAYEETLGFVTGDSPDYESFERTKENVVLNPFAAESDQRTWGDVLDDPNWSDIGKTLGWTMSYTADMGTFGKYGNAVFRDSRFSGNSVIELSPVGRELENVYNIGKSGASNLVQKGGEGFTNEVGKELYDFITPKIPVLGSQSLTKNKIKDTIFSKPKNNGGNGGSGILFESDTIFEDETETFGTDGVTFE